MQSLRRPLFSLISVLILNGAIKECSCRDLFVTQNVTQNVSEAVMFNSSCDQRITTLEQQVMQLQNQIAGNDLAKYQTSSVIPRGTSSVIPRGTSSVIPRGTSSVIPRDCSEIYATGTRVDGIYTISPDGRCPFNVYCELSDGGWTVIQRRQDGSVNFYKSWDEYVQGFGEIDGEHWLGLDKIQRLTKEGIQIYFQLENYDGTTEFAHYQSFVVHDATTVYRMNVDAFGYKGSIKELLSYHNDMKFSTYDRDNDMHATASCCETNDGGGWWYNGCYRLGNLNGVYGKQTAGGLGFWDGKHIAIKNVHINVKPRPGFC